MNLHEQKYELNKYLTFFYKLTNSN